MATRSRAPQISPAFKALIDRGSVTIAEYKALRGAVADWRAIIPALDDKALAYVVASCASNITPQHPWAHEWTMVQLLVPEIVKRLKEGT